MHLFILKSGLVLHSWILYSLLFYTVHKENKNILNLVSSSYNHFVATIVFLLYEVQPHTRRWKK